MPLDMLLPVSDDDLRVRLNEYAKCRKLKIHEHLGGGIQGIVFSTFLPSAVKVFKRREHYEREVAVYHRIKDRSLFNVCGFTVPKPLRRHDGLLVIEMELVVRPFVVDFASAGVDRPLFDHSPEILAEDESRRRDLFEDRWPKVRQIIAEFRRHGIFLADVKPGNIMFAD
ncbi:MAG TPA: hypothetical protein VKU82_05340 [Planctomycetaceae bacterium]|nr:hypothetical protein [Planctomycetaceae bacterium]